MAKEIVFFAPGSRHNGRMTGAFLNAIGILLGALIGLGLRGPVPARAQNFFKAALGVATAGFGLRLVYESVGGTFATGLKQIFLAMLAIVLGYWLGKLLQLQKISNRLGRRASNIIMPAGKNPQPAIRSLNACAVLFCAAPLGIVGAVADGLSGYFYLLAVKAVMDALAMTSFVKMFRWPVALAAFPVFVFLGGITVLCKFYAAPFLTAHQLLNSTNAVAGLICCAVALVIFEIRRVELANFLPALAVAPLITHWLG